ncbi:hypothetical protein F5148DRAFT_1368366 [Russula earlei]|uniref:Uncharacterized protein n=1 Tax=Russula earlei TaxID=71964 RepID=A0ACC0U776_9AGAM|nr:hypothetical protein F5148DRAFT_1368366 [Russula earlei]
MAKISLEVQRIVVRILHYHSPTITSTSPTPAPVIPAAPFAISAMQAVAPAPSVLPVPVPASPTIVTAAASPLRSHTIACNSVATAPHSSASVATTSVPISSAASVLALPAIVSTAPPAAASVVSSPAVSVVAVHAPSTVASVLPASFAILVSTTVVSTAAAACSIPSHMASPSPASVVSSPVLTPPTMPAASSDPSAISSAQSAVSPASPAAAVSALSAASAWPAVSLQSPGATTAPTSPVAAPALVLSAAVASAQSVALLISSSISVDVTPSAKVSVTHDTSNDALPSPHATIIAQEVQEGLEPKLSNAAPQKDQQPPSRRRHRRSRRRKHHIAPRLPFHRIPAHTGEDLVTLNDYGKRLQGEPRRPPPLVSSPTCALSSTRPTATCYGEDLDATAGRRQRDSHTSRARRLPPQQQQQQQKQRQWQQLGRHQQHHIATTHLTRRNHATPPPASPHRARIPGHNDTSTAAHNDSDDTFDMTHTPQARPRPILPCCNAHPLCDDETTRARSKTCSRRFDRGWAKFQAPGRCKSCHISFSLLLMSLHMFPYFLSPPSCI